MYHLFRGQLFEKFPLKTDFYLTFYLTLTLNKGKISIPKYFEIQKFVCTNGTC